ncbi:MAG: sigma-70 family RNA polymerase sigma factor [Saprospiraceae bacterium]|nr:sigma-70 family RNA polymerase sigma factor [Saprospiraceae bacterium]
MSENDFKKVYYALFNQVRTFIFSKSGDADLSEDLTQEAFVRMWKNMANVKEESAKSFLFTVSNHLFLDHVRHEKVIKNYAAGFTLRHDVSDPQFLVEMDEFKIQLDRTIRSMTPHVREVFLLSRIEKMTYQQIAQSLEVSVKTIEKRMQKALEIMATLRYT